MIVYANKPVIDIEQTRLVP